MFEDWSDKTEAATPYRRAEARREGNVARSADLTAAAMLLGGVLLVSVFVVPLAEGMRRMLEGALSGSGVGPQTGEFALRTLVPVALGLMLVGWAVGLIQTGFLFAPGLLTPKLSRLSPAQGFRQVFSGRGVTRWVMSLVKLVIVLVVSAACVWVELPRIVGLIELDAGTLTAGMAGVVWGLAWKVGAVLLVLGLVDYGIQWWHRKRELRMTRREWKDDLRRTEGDPMLRQRRAKLAVGQGRAHDVSGADLVIVHAARFAVALQHGEGDDAPHVIAKGVGGAARRMHDDAERLGVTVVENPELARLLHRGVDVGREIPRRYYDEIAGLLAWVYRLTGKQEV